MNDLPLRFLHDLRLGGVALLLCLTTAMRAADLWIEAEAFTNRGGWQVDQQFMDCMGSPYLLAHGLGSPVADAVTNITIPERNTYFIYVRTYNWTSPWSTKEGPGAFRLAVGGKTLSTTLGTTGNRWEWQRAGSISLPKGERTLRLIDLTGFDGRVDAIFISTVDTPPPSQDAELAAFRHKAM